MRPAVGISSHFVRYQRYQFQLQFTALQERIAQPASSVSARSLLNELSSRQFHTCPLFHGAVAAVASQAKLENGNSVEASSSSSEDKTVESVADDLLRKYSGNRARTRNVPASIKPLPPPPAQQPLPTWVKSDFDKLLLEQSDAESVLKLSQTFLNELNLTPQRAASVLVLLMKMAKQQGNQQLEPGNDSDLRVFLRSHATFEQLMKILKEGGYHLSHPLLMASLEAALTIGLHPSHPAVESLQNELLWRARKLTPHLLIKVAAFQSRFCDTHLQRRILDEVYRLLRRRCVEITSPREVLSVLHFSNDRLPAEIRCLFEERCASICEQFTLEECVETLSSLSSHGRRALPLLKALSAVILQFDQILPLKYAVDIGHALANLTFYNEMLMQKIIESMRIETNWINPNASNTAHSPGRLSSPTAKQTPALRAQFALNLTTNLLTIFGKLQYRDQEAIQMLTEKLREHRKYADVADWAAFVLACARIAPRDNAVMSDLLDDAVDVFRRNQPSMTPKQWLDLVCSLCELSHAPVDFVLDTLKTGVAPLLRDETSPTRANAIRCKLANIAAYAALELDQHNQQNDTNSNITRLTERCFLASPQELVGSRARDRLIGLVRQTLHMFAPQHKYLNFNTGFQLGYSTIVSEMLISATTAEPMPLPATETPRHLQVKPNEASDGKNNNIPVMVLAWDYSDFAWPTSQLLGVHVKAVEHFERLGFAVAQISHKEFNSLTTDVARVRHVKQRISEAVQYKLRHSAMRDSAASSSLFMDDAPPVFAGTATESAAAEDASSPEIDGAKISLEENSSNSSTPRYR